MNSMCTLSVMVFRGLVIIGAVSATAFVHAEPTAQTYQVGVAQVDITPSYPIRLNGFGSRRAESEGVNQRIWAKALAIGSDEEHPLVLVAIDSLGIRESMVEEVASRLKSKAGIRRDRIAVTFSHSHTTPKVNGASDTIFSSPIPPEHQVHIDRYTEELTDWVEEVALQALADRKPAELYWSIGKVGFAQNRRTPGGPVDHDLPMLVVKSPDGDVRAIYVSYACHCVTLSDNKISGDWSGFAQQAVQRKIDGAVCLVSIGCGSDANPSSGPTGDNLAVAAEQGGEIANEVERLLAGSLRPIHGALTAELNHVDLPLEPAPSREQLEALAAEGGPAGYNAEFQLAKLDRGNALLTAIDYPIQTWAFGDSLAMVFLAGEVCVDYSLRIKEELDPKRVWMHGYANDFCCYIPSERLLAEGGYGGGAEVVYFALPSTLQPGLEETIVEEVHRQVPDSYQRNRDPQKTDGTRPLLPQDSRNRIRVPAGLQVELVAAEPLVVDPVAIDWGYDGRLWVCEMHDYPLGLDGELQSGGRIVVLSDTDNDGLYDKRTVFADGLPFPTEVLAYGQGALVCAAPDVLYLQDSDGDGRADRTTRLFSGFATENYHARPNSLRYGLDNWWYGANGLISGTIRGAAANDEVNIQGRDFRFRPDTGELQAVSGLTQYGRVRDDWGNWFGCDNGTLLRHYPLTEHYTARNPHVAPPSAGVYVPDYPESHQLFPLGELITFKLSGPPGRPTAACGLEIYRDHLLGDSYYGNSFTCEPVNQLVHRLVLAEKGVTFSGRRAANEENSEFLASRDQWFRPVQARTGPDGCLWIVDMYRYVIEHPQWIPKETLAHLDVRAGDQQGRIYRVRPQNGQPRAIPNFREMLPHELVDAIQSPNGYVRDRAQQLLIERGGEEQIRALIDLAGTAPQAATRLSALCTLAGLSALDEQVLLAALSDDHPAVCRHAVRLAESLLGQSPRIARAINQLAAHPNEQVRMQVAYSLGESKDDGAPAELAKLACKNYDNPYLMSAVWSSVGEGNIDRVFAEVLRESLEGTPNTALIGEIVGLLAKIGNDSSIIRSLDELTVPTHGEFAAWQIHAVGSLLGALGERRSGIRARLDAPTGSRLQEMVGKADALALDVQRDAEMRLGAIQLLVYASADSNRVFETLMSLMEPANSPEIRQAGISLAVTLSAGRQTEVLTEHWASYSPELRSAALDVLLARDSTALKLLRIIEKGRIVPAQIDATRRYRLLSHANDEIREAASTAFEAALSTDRDAVVHQYDQVASLTGDRDRGRELFTKNCVACHRMEGKGHEVGPDLAALTQRSTSALLEAVFDPNRAVDQRYQQYVCVTTNGLVASGILLRETSNSITLLEQEGKEQTILRTQLDEFENTGKSIMPEGFEKDLNEQGVADLFAYLAEHGPSRKQLPGNSPTVVSAAEDGALTLSASNCEIFGQDIIFEEPHQNIGVWRDQWDHVAWNIVVEQDSEFDVYLEWACADHSAGNAYVIEGFENPLRGAVAGTGGYDKYQRVRIGKTRLREGSHRIILRPDGPLNYPNLMDLHEITLVTCTRVSEKPRETVAQPASAPAASDALQELLQGMEPGTPVEYERIPAIWTITIEAGKRNDPAELTELLRLSLPSSGKPLHDWQAVVIGGGVINGISQAGSWPKERIEELLEENRDLQQRWQRTIEQASAMADRPEVPDGTRYDALRILGADTWEVRGEQLCRYMGPECDPDLQAGAISALGDINHDASMAALLRGVSGVHESKQGLAIAAMLRTPERCQALLQALETNQIETELLSPKHIRQLTEHSHAAVQERAKRLLPTSLDE